MEMSKEMIISMTHYGVRVYAHVLRKYYQDDVVLRLRGKDCLPAKNPFNGDRCTLRVRIVDGVARHWDEEVKDCKGDAFDFAKMYYGLEGEALWRKLDEELGLGIGKVEGWCGSAEVVRGEHPHDPHDPQNPHYPYSEDRAIPEVSFFKMPVRNTVPCQSINLVDVYQKIKGAAYKKQTLGLRAIQDVQEGRAYKATQFDYVTFSGVFTKRENSALVQHSGLFAVDFDHVGDVAGLKELLLRDAYFETELLFVSPSGKGLKWVIPIDIRKATHQAYAVSISNYLERTYGQKMDASGKDVARACFLPWDPDVYINPDLTLGPSPRSGEGCLS
jgi:hypothetical protein